MLVWEFHSRLTILGAQRCVLLMWTETEVSHFKISHIQLISAEHPLKPCLGPWQNSLPLRTYCLCVD